MNALNAHINIRPATGADLETITRIYNQAVALQYVTADTQPVTVASRADMLETITQKQQRPFWVLEYEGKVTAFFYFRNFYDRPAYRITAEIGIYIDQSMHGKGLGKYILDFCCAQAPALGIENILALIFESNTPSIKLFEQKGFKRQGTFEKIALAPGGGYNTLIMFQKRTEVKSEIKNQKSESEAST